MEVATTTRRALPARAAVWRCAGIVLLVSSAAASAATNAVSGCQELSNNLQSLDTNAFELSIVLVDLPGNDIELGLAEPADTAEAGSDSTVPVFYLTPRAESMLREVFGDEAKDWDAAKWQKPSQISTGIKRNSSFPPIAEGRSKQPILPKLEETESPSPDESVPRFQRRMYRTDI